MEEYVAGVDAVAAFFDQLYDVVAVFDSTTFDTFLGSLRAKCGRCVFRIELCGSETGPAAAPCAAGVLAVEHGESRHFGLSGVDSIGISAQAVLMSSIS